jgi:mono/diheme cytochrome c family protein
MKRLTLALALTLSSLAACYLGDYSEPGAQANSGSGANASGGANTSSSGGGSGASTATTGLPCDVEAVLKRNSCLSCHGSGASLSAPMSLLSYADLTAPAKSDASKKVGEMVALRMRDAAKPMPPQGLAPAADADVIQAWVTAGYPKGECGTSAGDGAAPPPVVLQCTSGTYWSRGNKKSPEMNPGKACVTCHTTEQDVDKDAPRLLGGTLYPTFNEPDFCQGYYGATVVITDNAGRTYNLSPNYAGNFFLDPGQPLTFPIRAKVVHGKERVMNTPQMKGDCNSCHTERGANGAPGRIALPL